MDTARYPHRRSILRAGFRPVGVYRNPIFLSYPTYPLSCRIGIYTNPVAYITEQIPAGRSTKWSRNPRIAAAMSILRAVCQTSILSIISHDEYHRHDEYPSGGFPPNISLSIISLLSYLSYPTYPLPYRIGRYRIRYTSRVEYPMDWIPAGRGRNWP